MSIVGIIALIMTLGKLPPAIGTVLTLIRGAQTVAPGIKAIGNLLLHLESQPLAPETEKLIKEVRARNRFDIGGPMDH